MDNSSDIKSPGRPTDYSKELADKICERLTEGQSLRSVCRAEDMPAASTVFRWLRDHKEFKEQYAYAKQEATDALAEEIMDISDDTIDVIKSGAEKKSGAYAQAQRLRVDTRKWIMAKMKPKKYGDQLDLTSGGEKIAVLPAELYAKRNTPPSTSDNSQ